MACCGLVLSEHSSGGRTQRGSISTSGFAHLRRVLSEAVFAYQHRPGVNRDHLESTAPSAQTLPAFTGFGKSKGQVIKALARELTGFLWHITNRRRGETAIR